MSKYSMTKYLFLCNTSGTKPVLIFKGFRLDAHTEPMIPVNAIQHQKLQEPTEVHQ